MENPYEPPSIDSPLEAPEAEVVSIRREHLKHETSIKGAGLLYCLGGGLGLVAMLFAVVAMVVSGEVGAAELALFAVVFVLYGIALWVGIGLRRLRPSARVPTIILSALGLLAFPLGTILSAYILFLVVSAKGRMVLSNRYLEIVAATPEIKYRTPVWMWVVLALFVVAVFAMLFLVMRA